MKKLARVRDGLSLSSLVLSTREVYRWALLQENFLDLLSLSLSCARFLLFLHVLCFSINDLCTSAFPAQFFLLALPSFPTFPSSRIVPKSSFFFSFCIPPSALARWLCVVLPCINYEVLSFCHATGRTIATRERKKKTTTKKKKSCRCCYQCRCTHLARSFFSS